jgi:cytochrome c peroxidase
MFWKKWEDDGRCNLEHRPPTDYDKVGEEGEKFMVIEKKVFLCFLGGLLAVVLASAEPTGKLSPVEELGKKLFFDTNLSSPPGQSCAACHDPKAGWTGGTENPAGVYEGAAKGRFGNRKPPSSAYAGDSPVFHLNEDGEFVGGMFWDGRATGNEWGDPLAEQAGGPFLNPLEHNFPDRKAVVLTVRKSDYAGLFEKVWTVKPEDWDARPDKLYEYICRSIAAYERSEEVNPFASKFDTFWRAAVAKTLRPESISSDNIRRFEGLGLDAAELKGLLLFAGPAKCANCHTLTPGPKQTPPVFTDFKYDNIGMPRNSRNPFYAMDSSFNPDGKAWTDDGLGDFLKTVPRYASLAAANVGKHKVPTLRNIDRRPSSGFVKVFGHNGVFQSLKEIVHFYNTRDFGKFPPPEVKANINTEEMGNLGLTDADENALVAFLKTLTDGFIPDQPSK